MPRHMLITARVKLPEGGDIFAHADAVSALKGAVEAIKTSLPPHLDAEVSHAVVTARGTSGRRKAVAAPTVAETID